MSTDKSWEKVLNLYLKRICSLSEIRSWVFFHQYYFLSFSLSLTTCPYLRRLCSHFHHSAANSAVANILWREEGNMPQSFDPRLGRLVVTATVCVSHDVLLMLAIQQGCWKLAKNACVLGLFLLSSRVHHLLSVLRQTLSTVAVYRQHISVMAYVVNVHCIS